MIDDVQTPMSPGWWLDRLAKQLLDRRKRYDQLQGYVDNTAEIETVHGSKTTREAYSRLRRVSRTNFAELVVEAARERMRPSGFRTGASSDVDTDAEAWRIWQANSLDADSALVHRTALSLGDAYVIVGDVDDEIGAPVITPEDPREVIAEHDPIRRRKPVAALKMYHDDLLGQEVAYLYLPGRVLRATRRKSEAMMAWSSADWSWDKGYEIGLPGNAVPVVRFVNKPNLRAVGMGEFEAHVSVLDRINHQVLQRLEIATLQAFRQRAIKGVPNTDENGSYISYDDIFTASPGSLWLLPETAELWESGQVDLGPIRQAIRDDVQDLAAVTRTPLYYLSPDANNGSAEGASLAREGLIFKVEDRIAQAGESWERVMSLAFLMAGDEARAALGDMEVQWAPPERFSLAERYDAASKAQAAGVPWRQVMGSILQFSPQEVDRMEADRQAEALFADTLLGVGQSAAPAPAESTAPAASTASLDEARALKEKFDALGVAIRAGVEPTEAASRLGLEGIQFTGAVPVSLRLPSADAARLEQE